MLALVALLFSPAHADDVVVVVEDAPAQEEAECKEEKSPRISNAKGLHVGLTTEFLPLAPAQHLHGRLIGKKDAYVGIEGRFDPLGTWGGRASAGFDVFGAGNLDLTLGLFAGTAGDWEDRSYVRPIAGTEVAIGGHFEKLSVRYRWLAGLGGGPLDSFLSEQELRVGYRVVKPVHVHGSWTILDPAGPRGMRGGVGLGIEVQL
ncbi:MAG: hypothetical protein KC912_15445 [Proteobacteria bacterium]|nr:hypothetical protein [Pseudomonadota bacterium]